MFSTMVGITSAIKLTSDIKSEKLKVLDSGKADFGVEWWNWTIDNFKNMKYFKNDDIIKAHVRLFSLAGVSPILFPYQVDLTLIK